MEPTEQSLSSEVVDFLLSVVNGLTLSAGAPDFEQVAEMVVRTQQELRSLQA